MTPWIYAHQLSPQSQYNYFHCDAHYDCKKMDVIPQWSLAKIKDLSLHDFLNIKDDALDGKTPLFRWDNYVDLLLDSANPAFRKTIGFTQGIGQKASFDFEFPADQLIKQVASMFVDELQWVINIDADYFFARDFKDSPMYSLEFIKKFFELLYQHYQQNDIALISFALSPECCGGWHQAEVIYNIFKKVFQLPLII